MKSERLAVILLFVFLSRCISIGLTEPEKIILSEYFENQKKEMDEKKKRIGDMD